MVQHYGLLKLEIDGGESLTILDGKFLDKNVWLISMRPGLHTLAVQRKGYKTYEKHFEISDDDRLSFSISLEKDNDENAERVSQH